jgi:hypothetical protein
LLLCRCCAHVAVQAPGSHAAAGGAAGRGGTCAHHSSS